MVLVTAVSTEQQQKYVLQYKLAIKNAGTSNT